MKRRLVIASIGLVLVVNALVLAGVAFNRSGEPEAVLKLTERELAMPWVHWPQRENSGIALRISRAMQSDDWLDRDKLIALGFDPERFSLDVQRSRWRGVERPAWVVLEYDGPAFQAVLADQRETVDRTRSGVATGEHNQRELTAARERLEQLERAESRLLAVDAGTDRKALRERYPDRRRFALMRARVRMHAVYTPADEVPQVRAHISSLLPGRVHVPRHMHAELARATGRDRRDHLSPPRYRVELRFGRRGEPWLAGIEAMPEASD